MSYIWRFESADGRQVPPPDLPSEEPFVTRSDAESWLGECYRDLLNAGIDQVVLVDDSGEPSLDVYTMSLHVEHDT